MIKSSLDRHYFIVLIDIILYVFILYNGNNACHNFFIASFIKIYSLAFNIHVWLFDNI